MADPLSQDERAGKLTTPFGDNVLALSHMNAVEALSEMFEFRIEAVSLQANLDFNSALGLGATVKLTTVDNLERYFNGIMTEARWAGAKEDLYAYEIVLRPWLWLLTRTSDCRIFSSMTVTDIIKKVFTDRGFADFRDATINTPPTLEYCVQYRETDFDFVCRLMEEYGIYYYFEHSDGMHTLVLADGKSSHKPTPGLDPLPYKLMERGGRRELQHVETWSRGRRAQSGRFVLNDYDYNKPPTKLEAESEKPGEYAHKLMEMYDYPGDYSRVDEGTTLAKVKVEAGQSLDNRRTSMGSAPSLFPGARITLKDIPIAEENEEYLVTRCSHSVDAESYRSGEGTGDSPYVGHYEMTPSNRQYRAQLVTRRPEIAGPQSALVVGESGGEIDVDKLGRILVQFFWDRKKMKSRRVRVAQIWAGSNRGALFLPRIGDEVMIQYEEGDPDRPIVVGSVYNGTNTVPMTLPGKNTKSGILTRSSTGGNGYNMLLFDDTAGSENVKLRTQKDLKFKALHDQEINIGNDRTDKVANNIKQTVGTNHEINVGTKYTLTAGSQIVLTVGGSTITMDPSSITLKAPTITVKGDALVSISAPMVKINSGG
jgi:type VI secretion system secreted protein VgrG